jgi:UDP-glucose 6-dehydrogenase
VGKKVCAYALAFAQAGFKVTCADANQSVLKRLTKGSLQFGSRQIEVKLKSLLKKGQLKVATDLKTACLRKRRDNYNCGRKN